eukprot:13485135-Heterocapsa_arctica.AAC.1
MERKVNDSPNHFLLAKKAWTGKKTTKTIQRNQKPGAHAFNQGKRFKTNATVDNVSFQIIQNNLDSFGSKSKNELLSEKDNMQYRPLIGQRDNGIAIV